MISKQATGDSDAAKRFLREARVVSRLNHPRIMGLYDMDEADGRPFLVTELIAGRTLAAALPELTDTAKLEVGCQVADALAYAHAQDIVHRDLKTSNIMLVEAPSGPITVKLLDFGLALRLDASRITDTGGLIVGTVAYMAPEQAAGETVDNRADLYALGVILYEMFTGSLPHTGENILKMFYQILHVDPQPPRHLRPDLPTELDTLIVRLLKKNPRGRPAGATEVLRRLEAIQFDREPAAPAAPGPASGVRPVAPGVLVGRRAELTQIKSWIEETLGGQGQLGLVAGPGGIGKTHLVEEAAVYARRRGMQILSARIYSDEGTLPFQPVITTLRPVIAKAPTADSALQRLIEGVEVGAGALPEAVRRRLNDGFTQYLQARAAEIPLLFLFDDLHWADAATVSLLLHLARYTAEDRLLLLGTYSDDVPAPPGLTELLIAQKRERLGGRMALAPLSRRETAKLLETMFDSAISPSFIDTIFAETEGNPFYVGEIARWLVDEGIATRRDDRWYIDSATGWQLPPTLQGVIERHFERASPECRNTLEVASVIGAEFPADLLTRAAALGEDEVLDVLDKALAAGLIVPRRTGGRETFTFSHPTVRRLLYEGLNLHRRAKLHRAVGQALAQLHSSRIADYYGVLAHHFSLAAGSRAVRQAVTYALRAGDIALGRSDPEAALEYVRRARTWLESRGDDFEDLQLEAETKFAHLREMLGQEAAPSSVVARAGAIPWTPLTKPPAEMRIALASTAGVHLRTQSPFGNHDHSLRLIPAGTPEAAMMITHPNYDHSDADRDINLVFPLAHLRALAAKSVIGDLAPTHYGLMGHLPDPDPLLHETAPQLARQLKVEAVDGVLFTPG